MKYKVGDKVRVRKDLKVNGDYGLYEFTDEMNKYLGKTTTITGDFGYYYTLDIDNHVSGWTESMLEPVNENGQNTKKYGQKRTFYKRRFKIWRYCYSKKWIQIYLYSTKK